MPNEKTIRQAYRKLARKHHPDVNPGDTAAEERFKDINEANEVFLTRKSARSMMRCAAITSSMDAGRAKAGSQQALPAERILQRGKL